MKHLHLVSYNRPLVDQRMIRYSVSYIVHMPDLQGNPQDTLKQVRLTAPLVQSTFARHRKIELQRLSSAIYAKQAQVLSPNDLSQEKDFDVEIDLGVSL